jgi:hypothetical protein
VRGDSTPFYGYPFVVGSSQAETQPDGTWRVVGQVDAENSFSARLRSDFKCHLRYHPPSDRWEPIDVTVG